MNRQEFLRQLAQLLEDVPETERREALEYYNNYFDDAGPEKEAQVIQELGGSPEKAAASLKAELQSARKGPGNYGEYTEQGFRDTRIPHTPQMPRPVPGTDNDRTGNNRTHRHHKEHGEFFKDSKTRRIVLIILILCAASSIGIRLLGGIFGLVFGLLGGILSLVFGLLATVCGLAAGLAGIAIAAITSGIAMTAAGLVKCMANPSLGLLAAGLGLILSAVGILLLMVFLWLAVKILPRLARWSWKQLCRFLDWCREKWKKLKI